MEATASERQVKNDALRAGLPFTSGRNRLVVTRGVNAEGPSFVLATVEAVRRFSEFTEGNDPHLEHDFGAFEVGSKKLFWKIDYYDGAEGIDLLLTILLRDEY